MLTTQGNLYGYKISEKRVLQVEVQLRGPSGARVCHERTDWSLFTSTLGFLWVEVFQFKQVFLFGMMSIIGFCKCNMPLTQTSVYIFLFLFRDFFYSFIMIAKLWIPTKYNDQNTMILLHRSI